ncbi:TPA: hypothetical protein NJ621_004653 [Vibrio parahaemolyticus]|nr:hypothetical protein [Vibrio parahaemolyticus]
MSDKDMLDKSFDLLAHQTKWLYEQDLIKNWFNILSWTTLTSFVFVLYEKTGSIPLLGFGVVSSVLVFFYAWHTHFDIVNRAFANANVMKTKTMVLLFVISTSVPAMVMFYMFNAIGYMVQAST